MLLGRLDIDTGPGCRAGPSPPPGPGHGDDGGGGDVIAPAGDDGDDTDDGASSVADHGY